jgi:hypothetical protein
VEVSLCRAVDAAIRINVDGVDYSRAVDIARLVAPDSATSVATAMIDTLCRKYPAVCLRRDIDSGHAPAGSYLSDVALDLLIDGALPGWITSDAKDRLRGFREQLPSSTLAAFAHRRRIHPDYLNVEGFGAW